MRPDSPTITAIVQRNCDIADAAYAQNYSLCTYLLKMREFYRWRCGAALSSTIESEQLGDWLCEQESLWDEAEEEAFASVPAAATLHDPFDADAINAILVPRQLIYGAGVGRLGQPHFYLAELLRTERHDDVTVYVSDTEYARDMAAPPAMLSGSCVHVRRDSLRRTLWQSIDEWRWRRSDGPLKRIVAEFDFDTAPEPAIERITDHEIAAVILHECGEYLAGRDVEPEWGALLTRVLGTPAEHTVRAVRDHLADALSTLPKLVERGDEASLLWWFANLRGIRRELYPLAVATFQRWLDGAPLNSLEELLEHGTRHWSEGARTLVELHLQHHDDDAGLVQAISAAKLRLQA